MQIIVGTITYALIKILGYSLFAKYLNHLFSKKNNIWKIGIIRTIIGVILGAAHNAFFFTFMSTGMGRSPFGGEDTSLYIGMLILLRIFEWGLIIRLFYNKEMDKKPVIAKGIMLGIIWSFILDIPLMAGLFVVIASIC